MKHPILFALLSGVMAVSFSSKEPLPTNSLTKPENKKATVQKKSTCNFYLNVYDCTVFPYNEADLYSFDIDNTNYPGHVSCGVGTSTMVPNVALSATGNNVTIRMGLSAAFNYGVLRETGGSVVTYFYYNPWSSGVYNLGGVVLDASGSVDYEIAIYAN